MYKRILVPVDGSETARQALAAAIGLAATFNSRIRVVHVIDEWAYVSAHDEPTGYSAQLIAAMRNAGNEILQDAMATVRAAGIEVDNMLFDRFGDRLGETVARAAKLWDADLVVVGTHGRKGFQRLLLGSGAEEIIRSAPVPVLVMRAPQDTSTQEKP